MRRILVPALLIFAVALPACAQRWGSGSRGGGSVGVHSGRGGGSAGFRSGGGGFSSHGGTAWHGGGTALRGDGIAIGGRGSFGHNPRVNVFVGTRPSNHPRRWSVYPYRYAPSYVYPYVAYPVYPLSYYDAYDYATVPVQPSYPYYEYGYASGGDNYPASVGLAEQMRQQQVGIYAQPQPAPAQQSAPVPSTPQPEQPSTMLIYRDGHNAEVRNYAIVGQTLWIFSEERALKIPLAQLDIEATRKANEERGIEFLSPR